MKPRSKFHSRIASGKAGIAAMIATLAFVHSAIAQTNTRTGRYAGGQMTTGKHNTSNGYAALQRTNNGSYNTAVGSQALQFNIDGINNTASGYGSMKFNASGSFNTATGSFSLFRNTSGKFNTATGREALFDSTTGSNNVAQGYQSLRKNKTGGFNVAIGDGALWSNTTGSSNIGIGEDAGYNLTTGSNNICIGHKGVAGQSGIIRLGESGTHSQTRIAGIIYGNGAGLTSLNAGNIASGTLSDSRLSANVARRNGNAFTGTNTFSNDVTIGNDMIFGTSSDKGIRWQDGSTLKAHIFRYNTNQRLYFTNSGTSNLTGVYLASGATSFTSTSDLRLKRDIEPITGILDKIKPIRVVGFNMASMSSDPATGRVTIDRDTPPRVTRAGKTIKHQIGSIAQDWLADFPELVVEPDSDDGFYGLDYDRIGVVALGGVKELHARLLQKSTELAQVRTENSEMARKIEDLESRMIRLESSLATSPEAPRTVSVDLPK